MYFRCLERRYGDLLTQQNTIMIAGKNNSVGNTPRQNV